MGVSDDRDHYHSDMPVKHEASDYISQAEEGTGDVQTHNVELRRDLKARHITMIGMFPANYPDRHG